MLCKSGPRLGRARETGEKKREIRRPGLKRHSRATDWKMQLRLGHRAAVIAPLCERPKGKKLPRASEAFESRARVPELIPRFPGFDRNSIRIFRSSWRISSPWDSINLPRGSFLSARGQAPSALTRSPRRCRNRPFCSRLRGSIGKTLNIRDVGACRCS